MASDNSKKAQNAERRARIAAMRQAEKARDKRNRIITLTAVVVVLAGAAGGGWYLFDVAQDKEQAKAAPVQGEQTWADLGRDHVQKKVDYPMSPPAGGNHNPAWADCDAKVYTKQVPAEKAVHSLEHGAVWVTYNDKASKAGIKQLAEKVSKTPYSFMSPYQNQSSPITLTAWGHQLGVKDASDPRVDAFFDRYVQGDQTPEPGASCSAGNMQ
jgi:hypothetical protein